MNLLDFLRHPILRDYVPSVAYRASDGAIVGSIVYEGETLAVAVDAPDPRTATGPSVDLLVSSALLSIARRRALVTPRAPADDPHFGGLRVDQDLRAVYLSPAEWGDLVHRIRTDEMLVPTAGDTSPDRVPSPWGVLSHGVWIGHHLIPVSSLRDAERDGAAS